MNKAGFTFLCCMLLLAVLPEACKKDDPQPQPVVWDNDWARFQGTLIDSNDTTEFGFSSNQHATCNGFCYTEISLMPNGSEARYSSSIQNQYYRFEVKRGVLYFTGPNWNDKPDSTAFTNYFHTCYDSLTDDLSYTPGVEIYFTDQTGWTYSSTGWLNSGNPNYQCRITDYHPFQSNGVNYVKVRMYFDNIYLQNSLGDWLLLKDCEYEGYFVNN